jgi:hypothetical protein
MGAPINNPGYYDIPINNQYSNKPPSGYITDVKPENNYLENKPMPGYFDPAIFSEDSKIPLMKKKDSFNETPMIEEFRGGGGGHGGGHRGGGGGHHGGGHRGGGGGHHRGGGHHGGRGYHGGGGGYGGGYYGGGLYSDWGSSEYLPLNYWDGTSYGYPDNEPPVYNIYPTTVVEQNPPPQTQKSESIESMQVIQEELPIKIKKNKCKKIKKREKKEISKNNLWLIIIFLIIIILLLILKILYDNKIIKNFKF